jgi:DNA-directed RNA polymerase specialized sigma24 family protein
MAELVESNAIGEKEIPLATLYQSVFPVLCRYISKKGGSLEESKDIFHDALIIFYEKCSAGADIADEKAYVFGIAKHLWNTTYNEKQRYAELDELVVPADADAQEVVSTKLLLFLKQTGSKCMDLLQSFYYENLNAEKIAERFGYSGVRSATVQKFKCLEKIRQVVKTNAQQYEDFFE